MLAFMEILGLPPLDLVNKSPRPHIFFEEINHLNSAGQLAGTRMVPNSHWCTKSSEGHFKAKDVSAVKHNVTNKEQWLETQRSWHGMTPQTRRIRHREKARDQDHWEDIQLHRVLEEAEALSREWKKHTKPEHHALLNEHLETYQKEINELDAMKKAPKCGSEMLKEALEMSKKMRTTPTRYESLPSISVSEQCPGSPLPKKPSAPDLGKLR